MIQEQVVEFNHACQNSDMAMGMVATQLLQTPGLTGITVDFNRGKLSASIDPRFQAQTLWFNYQRDMIAFVAYIQRMQMLYAIQRYELARSGYEPQYELPDNNNATRNNVLAQV